MITIFNGAYLTNRFVMLVNIDTCDCDSVVMFVPTTNTKCLRSSETWAQRVCVCVCDSAASPLLELIRRCGAWSCRTNQVTSLRGGALQSEPPRLDLRSTTQQISRECFITVKWCDEVIYRQLSTFPSWNHTLSHVCLVMNMDRFC